MEGLTLTPEFIRGAVDFMTATDTAEHLAARNGNDVIIAMGGDDILLGADGNDRLYGNQGADVINGGADRDLIFGGKGNDFIDGGMGGDDLRGDLGDDNIYGNAGDDVLSGGEGTDTLTGGTGDDVFNLSEDEGVDIITDFENATDKVHLPEGVTFEEINLVDIGENRTAIAVASTGEQIAILEDVPTSLLDDSDFFDVDPILSRQDLFVIDSARLDSESGEVDLVPDLISSVMADPGEAITFPSGATFTPTDAIDSDAVDAEGTPYENTSVIPGVFSFQGEDSFGVLISSDLSQSTETLDETDFFNIDVTDLVPEGTEVGDVGEMDYSRYQFTQPLDATAEMGLSVLDTAVTRAERGEFFVPSLDNENTLMVIGQPFDIVDGSFDLSGSFGDKVGSAMTNAVGGAAAGATAGSLVPGLGTTAGAVGGAVIGGVGGYLKG